MKYVQRKRDILSFLLLLLSHFNKVFLSKQVFNDLEQWFPTFYELRNTFDQKKSWGTLQTKKSSCGTLKTKKPQRSIKIFEIWICGTVVFHGTVVGNHRSRMYKIQRQDSRQLVQSSLLKSKRLFWSWNWSNKGSKIKSYIYVIDLFRAIQL